MEMSENWRPMFYTALEIMLATGITGTIKTICNNGDECDFHAKLIGFPAPVANFRKLVKEKKYCK